MTDVAGSTEIMFVLDRSMSMSGVRQQVIDGFNKLIAEQRVLPTPCFVSLVQFDHEYQEDFMHMPLADVPDLTALTYVPRGNTALNDALGRSVTSLGTKIDAMAVAERPERVIVVVHTDGAENASKEFTSAQLRAMVKEHQEEGGWLFVFAAANIDAFAAGDSLGVSKGATAGYQGSKMGTEALYGATSQAVLRSRQMSHTQYGSVVRGAAGASLFNAAEVNAMATGDVSMLGGVAGTSPASSEDPIVAARKAAAKRSPVGVKRR